MPLSNEEVTQRDPSTSLPSGRDDKKGGVSGRNDEHFVAVRLPDLIIVDGGKGQLSAACRELQRLGLHDLPIIGLAKEREEIYRPGRALPCDFQWIPLPFGSFSASAMRHIGLPIRIINCS